MSFVSIILEVEKTQETEERWGDPYLSSTFSHPFDVEDFSHPFNISEIATIWWVPINAPGNREAKDKDDVCFKWQLDPGHKMTIRHSGHTLVTLQMTQHLRSADGNLLLKIAEAGDIWWDLVISEEIWRYLSRSGDIWGDLGISEELCIWGWRISRVGVSEHL